MSGQGNTHSNTGERLQAFLAHTVLRGTDARAVPAVHPNATPMHLGLDAQSFLIETPGADRFFLKLYEPGLPQFDFGAAVTAARQAGQIGIAPPVVADDAALGALLFARPEPSFRMATLKDLLMPAVQQALVARLKQWHAAAPLPRRLALFETPHDLRAKVEEKAAAILPLAAPRWVMLVEWIARIASALAANPFTPSPVHGELLTSNVMIGPEGGILLVDFDYATQGDPSSDLAALLLELCEFEEDYSGLVELYAGRADPALQARAQLNALLEDFRWGAWALLMHATAPRSGEIAFLPYATHRFDRCVGHLQQWDVDALMRRLHG